MWFWLVGAVVAEVFATITLRFTEGFTRLVPSLLVVLGYGTAFFALSQAEWGCIANERLIQIDGIDDRCAARCNRCRDRARE